MGESHDPRDYVHPETGELYVPKEDLENCEAELRKARRRITALERAEERFRASTKDRKRIVAAIERWKAGTKHPQSKVTDTRIKLFLDRRKEGYLFDEELNGHPEPTFELAIDGLIACPYVDATTCQRKHIGTPKERYDELHIALRSGERLERFARIGWQARRNGA